LNCELELRKGLNRGDRREAAEYTKKFPKEAKT